MELGTVDSSFAVLTQLLHVLQYDFADLQAALDSLPEDDEGLPSDEPPEHSSQVPRCFPEAGKHIFPLRLLGPALARLREDRGLTRGQVMGALGLPASQLWAYERGLNLPRIKMLFRVLLGLKSSFADLQRAIDDLRRRARS